MAENDQIDQLWYTFAAVGFNSIRAGFRVRAASGALKDIMGERFQHLDQYLRYRLPNGADRFDPTYAPPTLALLHANTGERTERILVNKYYTGRDKVGRPGAFFAHLLAPLPPDFTTRDAFLLWRSPLWRFSDEHNEYNEVMTNSVELRPTSLQQFRAQWEHSVEQLDVFQLNGVDSEQLRAFLPDCIAAYLLWRTEWENQQGKPSKHLYIVADANMVGAFLLALALCLPDELLNGITFSTYEKDVQAAGSTMLAGITFSNEMVSNREDIPPSCYVQDIVVNSYYNKNTPLESYALIIGTDIDTGQELTLAQIAAVVAKDITARLVPTKKGTLQTFRSNVEKVGQRQVITVENFLRRYKMQFLDLRRKKDQKLFKKAQKSFEEIENNPAEAGTDLVEPGAVSDYLDEALRDPQWGSTIFLRGLQKFVDYRAQEEELANALYEMGLAAEERFVVAIEHGQAMPFGPLMIEVMKTVAPVQRNSMLPQQLNALFFAQAQKIWNASVYYLRNNPASTPLFLDFFLKNPSYYFSFLTRWAYTLLEDEYPLLEDVLRVPWQASEEFFGLKIPRQWIDTAFAASPIPPEIARAPGQLLLQRVKAEMLRCLQARHWQQAVSIYRSFEAAPWLLRQDLLTMLLDSPLSFRQEQQFITDENRLWFLQHYGQSYLKQNLQARDWQGAVTFYRNFAPAPWSYQQDLVTLLLDSPLSAGHEHEFITDENRLWFLQRYGQVYLSHQRGQIIAEQFSYYVRNEPNNKFAVLRTWLAPLGSNQDVRNREFVAWLESPQSEQNMEMVLGVAHLQGEEIPYFLETYGEYYFHKYERSYLSSERTYMTKLLKDYLAQLHELELQSASSQRQRFVMLLRKNAVVFSKDVQLMLAELSLRDIFRAANSRELGIGLAGFLEERPDHRQVLHEKLASLLIEKIPDETYLVEVIATIGETRTYAPNDLFGILLVLAQTLHDKMSQQASPIDILALYVNFVFFANVLFVKQPPDSQPVSSKDDYQVFQKQFLDPLLQGVSSNILETLQQRLSNESVEMLKAYIDGQTIPLHDDQQQLVIAKSIYIETNSVSRSIETDYISIDKIFDDAKNGVELLENLRPVVQQVQISRYELCALLSWRFVATISSETCLAEVFRMMKVAFTAVKQYDVFLQMAGIVSYNILYNNRDASQSNHFIDRIILYIKFMGHMNVMFEMNDDDYKRFKLNFLDRLLEGLDASTFDIIERRLPDNDRKLLGGHRKRPKLLQEGPRSVELPKSNSAHGDAYEQEQPRKRKKRFGLLEKWFELFWNGTEL